MFNIASESSKMTIWRCKFCYKISHRCPARIHTTSSKSDLQILRQIGDHDHELVIPRSRADINLPGAGDQFLKYDSGPSDDRMLIFTTDSYLNFLKWCDTWLVDGTFKSSPSLFSQLFVIHGLRRNTTVPLVYVLTPRRDSSTYNKMLEQLKVLNGNLRPSCIMSDFDMASI